MSNGGSGLALVLIQGIKLLEPQEVTEVILEASGHWLGSLGPFFFLLRIVGFQALCAGQENSLPSSPALFGVHRCSAEETRAGWPAAASIPTSPLSSHPEKPTPSTLPLCKLCLMVEIH